MTESSNLDTISIKQERIRKQALERYNGQIWSLNQYLDEEWLKEAHRRTRKDGATGIDGISGKMYEENLEENLQNLTNKAKLGIYRAPAVRRVYIPKPGKPDEQRPIGIPTYEDKLLQRGVAMILEPIFEAHFKPCSYGFRPNRSAHDALEALWKATMSSQEPWIIDIDIKGFFDNMDKNQIKIFLKQWVSDGVINRLVGKWLRAGVMEGNRTEYLKTGTPQGGVISPLLSNLYLHNVLDAWLEDQVKPRLRGKARLIRYADDGVPRARRRLYEAINISEFVCNCKRDGGRSSEVALQEETSNHFKLHWPKSSVVSGKEKVSSKISGENQEDEAYEPLLKCRKRKDEIETEESSLTRDKSLAETWLLAKRSPVWRWREPDLGSFMERGNLIFDAKGDNQVARTIRLRVPRRRSGADQSVVVTKLVKANGAKGLSCPSYLFSQPKREELN